MINRIHLHPDYSISQIVKGGWHLAGGHGSINVEDAVSDMLRFVQAGITTFDCADIYTGVEEMIGRFLKEYRLPMAHGSLLPVQVHTKYVPDYDQLPKLRKHDTERIIDRSLKRLNVEQLDLVQFAWWDYNISGHVDAAGYLRELQHAGKIKHLGVTNYDADHLQELIDAGIEIISNQVQYSVFDHRPEPSLIPMCRNNNIHLLCYGVLAGGFLSDRYLGKPDPKPPLENRSLIKYRLIIDEFGGYKAYQNLLGYLRNIASKYQVGISEVAIKYILQKDQVAGVIIGARNSNHLDKLSSLADFNLENDDVTTLDRLIAASDGPNGPVYQLERNKNGKHGRIMRYNLNKRGS